MQDIKTLTDFDFKDKKVLIRTDYNVPMEESGEITDSKRIEDSLPTLKYLLEHGAKQILIMAHVGRPKNNEEKLKTNKIASKLSEFIGEDVKKIDGWAEDGLGNASEAKIIMLENMRFNPAEKSKDEAERDIFAEKICKNADLFIMEAFSNMHHGSQASMTSPLKFLPSCLGKAAEKEIKTISEAIENPKRPFVSIIGGVKAEKLGSVKAILENADKVLLGGALAFGVLSTYGYKMGKSKIDYDGLKEYEEFLSTLRGNPKILLPIDCVIADKFSDDANSKMVPIAHVDDNWMALDLGRKSLESYCIALMTAKTIIWNGPIGVFEFDKFAEGTKDIAKTIANTDATSIIGGGDSAAAIKKLGFDDKVTFISSGGGASLMMFEGKELPVIAAMKENTKRFS